MLFFDYKNLPTSLAPPHLQVVYLKRGFGIFFFFFIGEPFQHPIKFPNQAICYPFAIDCRYWKETKLIIALSAIYISPVCFYYRRLIISEKSCMAPSWISSTRLDNKIYFRFTLRDIFFNIQHCLSFLLLYEKKKGRNVNWLFFGGAGGWWHVVVLPALCIITTSLVRLHVGGCCFHALHSNGKISNFLSVLPKSNAFLSPLISGVHICALFAYHVVLLQQHRIEPVNQSGALCHAAGIEQLFWNVSNILLHFKCRANLFWLEEITWKVWWMYTFELKVRASAAFFCLTLIRELYKSQ